MRYPLVYYTTSYSHIKAGLTSHVSNNYLMYQLAICSISLTLCGPTQLIHEIPPPHVNPRTHIYMKVRYIIAGGLNNLIDPPSYPKHMCPNV